RAATDAAADGSVTVSRSGLAAHPGIAALRAQGADRSDPIRFRYLQALARRAAGLHGESRRVLDEKLGEQLAAAARHADALQSGWAQTVPAWAQRHPQAAAELQRLQTDGDARAMRRLVARLEGRSRAGPLSELLQHIARQSGASAQIEDSEGSVTAQQLAGAPADLKTVRRDKDAWARLRVDQQLMRSHQKAPDKPGPLNSHLLVLRSMQRMHDIAPEYLAHFMSHVETLLWLDQAATDSAAPAAKGTRPVTERKKPGMGRVRRKPD
ncbi:MAG: DUF2894 domain-containing protein, partial [Burkholderiaceae bacterium]